MCAGGVAWLSEEWGSPVPLPLGQATPTRAPKIALMPPHTLGGPGDGLEVPPGEGPGNPPPGSRDPRTADV